MLSSFLVRLHSVRPVPGLACKCLDSCGWTYDNAIIKAKADLCFLSEVL